MAEMNFGPPQMSINSEPRLTYGTIISSNQLFTQAQWHALNKNNNTMTSNIYKRSISDSSPSNGSPRANLDGERIDSARREWERATPENLRRVHAKDLRKIMFTTNHPPNTLGQSIIASASSSTPRDEFSRYLSGPDLTASLLSTPRLIKRPFDPLICENMILSRATALVPLPNRNATTTTNVNTNNGKSPSSSSSSSSRSPTKELGAGNKDPWFDSMEDYNTRLALEVNLVLMLCQALEGVKSPRLAVRDRELIVRETATELGVFFEFLEHRGQQKLTDWPVAACLVDLEARVTRLVKAPVNVCKKLPARFLNGVTYEKIPIDSFVETETNELESRSNNDIVTTGRFNVIADTGKFLSLLGKLLKSTVESLDFTQFES